MTDAFRESLPDLPAAHALSQHQLEKLIAYGALLHSFNRKLNLVSRESSGEIESIHIPHCLSLLMRSFAPGTTVVDWGTGGGLPAIPLAIARPDLRVFAVDTVAKKILAVQTMARRLHIANMQCWCGDAGAWPGTAHYSVSRAVAPLADLWRWHRRIGVPGVAPAGAWKPGLVCLKGGELTGEIAAIAEQTAGRAAPVIEEIELYPIFQNVVFQEKKIVHVHATDQQQ